MIDVLPQLKQTILTATLSWDSKAIELCLNLLFRVRGQKLELVTKVHLKIRFKATEVWSIFRTSVSILILGDSKHAQTP